MKQKRDNTIDILKGIGILLVVVGHSCGPLTDFIYLFHMQLFFMSAGYCFNMAYSRDIKGVISLTKRRLKSLWIPYVVGNSIFILLNNLFLQIGLYTSDPEFLEGTIGNSFGLGTKASVSTTINWLVHCVLFNKSTQLSSSSWFIEVLFFITIMFAGINLLIQRIKEQKLIAIVNSVIAILFLVTGYLVSGNSLFMKYRAGVILSSYIFFFLGYQWKKCHIKTSSRMQALMIVGALVVLVILQKLGFVQISANEYTDPVFFLLCGIIGWILVWNISSLIDSLYTDAVLTKWLKFLGRSSMIILFVHLLFFKPITWIQTIIYELPTYRLASFHVLYSDGLWWLAYSFSGVLLSLCVVKMWEWIKQTSKGIRKYHKD